MQWQVRSTITTGNLVNLQLSPQQQPNISLQVELVSYASAASPSPEGRPQGEAPSAVHQGRPGCPAPYSGHAQLPGPAHVDKVDGFALKRTDPCGYSASFCTFEVLRVILHKLAASPWHAIYEITRPWYCTEDAQL